MKIPPLLPTVLAFVVLLMDCSPSGAEEMDSEQVAAREVSDAAVDAAPDLPGTGPYLLEIASHGYVAIAPGKAYNRHHRLSTQICRLQCRGPGNQYRKNLGHHVIQILTVSRL